MGTSPGRLIEVVFDPAFKPEPLVMPIAEPTENDFENNAEERKHELDQTKVYGVQVPMIAINNIFIDFSDVMDFSLKSIEALPTVRFTVHDKYGLIEAVETPGMDNEIRIDIIPKFENAYKKIELLFYINNIKANGKYLTVSGLYKYPGLSDTRFESFGEVSTYELFEEIAKNVKLGFATNVIKGDSDKRYVYCDYKSYNSILNREICLGGSDNEILDYWVDFWNYIVLADMKERYESIDTDEQIKIWVAKSTIENNMSVEIEPVETVAVLTNHPTASTSELYIKGFDVANKSGFQMTEGTDRVYSVYENDKWEHSDTLVVDGDVKKDIFTRFDYIGEIYAKYNYLKQKCLRTSFLQKVNSETIKVTLGSPIFGLMRGDKVNLFWYKNDDMLQQKLDELNDMGVINKYDDIELNIPVVSSTDGVNNPDNGAFMLDRAISGQYLITACELSFIGGQWQYIMTLNKPANQKPDIIKIKE